MDRHELIREFINQIDPEIELFYDDDFYVDVSLKEVTYTFMSYPEIDKQYANFVKENFGEEINVFLISLLHECGHIMTYTSELDKERDFLYFSLQMRYKKEEEKKYNMAYFNIPFEYKATEWGVNFYRNNKELCDNFISELCK